jgi:hypothetical protein
MNALQQLQKSLGMGEGSAAGIARARFMGTLSKYDSARYEKLRGISISDGLDEINAVCDEVGYKRAAGSDEVASHLSGLIEAMNVAIEARKKFKAAMTDGTLAAGETALDALEDACVVSFEVEDGFLFMHEECDRHYGVKLTKAQAQQMVAEIQALIDNL